MFFLFWFFSGYICQGIPSLQVNEKLFLVGASMCVDMERKCVSINYIKTMDGLLASFPGLWYLLFCKGCFLDGS